MPETSRELMLDLGADDAFSAAETAADEVGRSVSGGVRGCPTPLRVRAIKRVGQ